MIKEYTDYIYWPINERFSENSTLVPVDSLINNENFINMLSIKRGSVANYYDLNKYYDLRSSILAYLSMIMFISGSKKPFKLNEIFNKFLVDEDIFYL